MDVEKLEELGFTIDPEQQRGVFWLDEDERDLSIVIEQDETIKLMVYGLEVQPTTDKSTEATIKGLITLFNNANVKTPF